MTHTNNYIIIDNDESNIIEVVDAPPGPQGEPGPSVHWASAPPEPEDGKTGDFWVVTE